MAKAKRVRKQAEPEVIKQADPTPEQRKKAAYIVEDVENPWKHTKPGEPARTLVCKRIATYELIAARGHYSRETISILDWYADRYALASSGFTMDSLAKINCAGGGGIGPGEAAMNARSDCQWAREGIKDGLFEFMAVMHDDLTFEQIGANSYQRDKASKMFKLAASWLLLTCGDRIMA